MMFVPIFACLFGCGEQVNVTVEAQAGPQARAETHFVMAASDPIVKPGNPDYLIISKAIARALKSQGFVEAAKQEPGDLEVVIDWMVSDPKVVARHAGGDIGEPQVRGSAPGRAGMPVGGTNNSASFGFGVEGQDRGELVYTRVLTLKAVDRGAYAIDPKDAQPVWSMTLTSDGDTDDVAKFAPEMVAAAMPYMATNAGKVRARLGSAEDPVKYVRGDIPALPARKP